MYRIIEYKGGFVSQIRYPKWTLFGIKYKWKHFISVSGISDKPWVFNTWEMAREETLNKIKWGILFDN